MAFAVRVFVCATCLWASLEGRRDRTDRSTTVQGGHWGLLQPTPCSLGLEIGFAHIVTG